MTKKLSAQRSTKTRFNSQSGWLKVFSKDYPCDDKDEVLDAVYWTRQLIALLMGIIWGFLAIKGFMGILLFAVINSAAAYVIANSTNYDFEPDDNFLPVKEGFMTTFATFLVSWIVTYTAVNFEDK